MNIERLSFARHQQRNERKVEKGKTYVREKSLKRILVKLKRNITRITSERMMGEIDMCEYLKN